MLSEYNKKRFNPIIYIYQFDKTYASDFLDYILIDRDSSARTRNNYRTWLSSFGSWLLEKQYIDKNPVENIKSLSERTKKKRDALSANDLQKLRTYLEKNNPYFSYFASLHIIPLFVQMSCQIFNYPISILRIKKYLSLQVYLKPQRRYGRIKRYLNKIYART